MYPKNPDFVQKHKSKLCSKIEILVTIVILVKIEIQVYNKIFEKKPQYWPKIKSKDQAKSKFCSSIEILVKSPENK